jgi:hypothetical protein
MKVVVVVQGGIVQEVITDEELVDVVIVDRDTDGLSEDEVKVVDGKESYVYGGLQRAETNPEKVEEIFKEVHNN